MKKIFLIGLGIIILIIIGVVISNQNHTLVKKEVQISETTVKTQDGSIIEGNEVWEKFKSNASSGNVDEIKIINELEGKLYKYTLKYDGEFFSFCDEEGTVSTKKKYLLDVYGEMPITENENKKSRMAVLANQEYTFDELFLSTITSNSAGLIDYEIIFWE